MRTLATALAALAIGCTHMATTPRGGLTTAERAPVLIGDASVETTDAGVSVASHRLPPPTVSQAVEAGRQWRFVTPRGPVHVWIPAGYERSTAMTIVYVHGYFTDVDRAWVEHQLPRQFARSGLNAMFVACGAPGTYGQPVVWDSLPELLHEVQVAIEEPIAGGRIVAVGHSAAFRTLTSWVQDRSLDTLVLFDAAYEFPQFLAWINASPDHRLIDVGDDTRPWTEQLHRALPESVVVDHMPAPAEDVPTDAHILYIKSEVGHMPLVTGGVALPTVLRALTDQRVRGAPAVADDTL